MSLRPLALACLLAALVACKPSTPADTAPRCEARTPAAETCNNSDDDCDGDTDEGEGLCDEGWLCDRGVCVPPCTEVGCFTDEECADVTCEAGLGTPVGTLPVRIS